MPVTKRTSKIVFYNELDDDDDFIPIVDSTKKNRNSKISELKETSKQLAKTREEKISPFESQEPVLILEPVKQPIIVVEENPISTSQSSSESIPDVDEEHEDLSPKTKRMKHEDVIEENESDHENEAPISKNELSLVDHQPLRRPELPARRSSAPLGFPTSKINIPSPHVSRVGLSRKSVTLKPLHPKFTPRASNE
ncbi:unnamed protein product [Adineta ricciae]|uniref:RAD51 interacting motif domain-containing protein n=1 Tax=Adineta ricciae TaxID=249248 RepID=A0A815W2J6_ADIRI|nr:unnamed protein product [Adineta ricciae]